MYVPWLSDSGLALKHSEIGFVVGLRAEARLLRQAGFAVGIGGGLPAGASAAARLLVADGAKALVSFGLAGGLAPWLRPGAVLVPAAVVESDEVLVCDAALVRWLGGPVGGNLLAGQEVLSRASDKAAAHAATGAAAVDLESGEVARAAVQAGLAFAVLRAVADPAARDLPAAALLALDASGTIGLSRVLLSLLRQPRQLPGLMALARDAAAARRALIRHLATLQ